MRRAADVADDDETFVTCDECPIKESVHYASGAMHRLTLNMRHVEDAALAAFLAIVRERLPTEDEIRAVFGHLVLDAAGVAAFLLDPSARSIHTHNKDVRAMNARRLAAAFSSDEIFNIEPCHNLAELVAAGVVITRSVERWLTSDDFHQLPQIAVGAPVRMLANLDIPNGIVNGGLGVVIAIKRQHYNQVLRVTTITVRVDSTGFEHNFLRMHWETLEGTVAGLKRQRFPLALAYASTAHAAQGAPRRCSPKRRAACVGACPLAPRLTPLLLPDAGATMRHKTLIDIRKAFCPGQTFVMLSRNPAREPYMRFAARLPTPREFQMPAF